MKISRLIPCSVGFLGTLLNIVPAPALNAAPATDNLGAILNHSMVWTQDHPSQDGYLHAGFRRSFQLATVPASANIHLFAYTRYQLFVNGEYIGRGPNRFENLRPEYDTWNIGKHLRVGQNSIAVLVHREWPGIKPTYSGQTISRIRRHAPGFTALIEFVAADNRKSILSTDGTWSVITETGYGTPAAGFYSSIPDQLDARKTPDGWTSPQYDDRSLPKAVMVNTTDPQTWPVLSPRTIPMLREKDIPFVREQPQGNNQIFRCPRIVQAYWVLDVHADAGAKLVVTPMLPEGKHGPSNVYTCRQGPQRWIGGDTFAMNALAIRMDSGKADVRLERLVEVLYPFDRIGSFSSSDPFLDQVWKLAANSLELLSEDAYTDCADRERSEWMDCDPPMYDATRVMMAGPGPNGSRLWSDPRLFANMLRRVAYTQEPDGMLRARTCSELVDIHTRMEDRACDWVDGLRKYYEATGDKPLVRELWPYCERLLEYFAKLRAGHGLVKAREWIAWDNPMSYVTSEGAANNAFFQRAFADAAWLASEIGNTRAAAQWKSVADQLFRDFNRSLWDEQAGAYCSSIGTTEIHEADRHFRKAVTLQSTNGRTEPTLHANLFALDRGLVPPERRAGVCKWVIDHDNQIQKIMAHYYYFKILYGLDQEHCDRIVLDRIRTGWKGMVESPWQTSWEGFTSGSKVHCYGIVPGYILSAYVLGVRRDAPVWKRELIIEPHLGDLTRAEGTVVTEFGPVPVSWRSEKDSFHFKVDVPENTVAILALPKHEDQNPLKIDGQTVTGTGLTNGVGNRLRITLASGSHNGSY